MEISFSDFMFRAELPLEWQDELAAKTAALAHFWLVDHLLATLSPEAMQDVPAAIPARRLSQSHFVSRSQILRALGKPAPGEVEEHRLDAEEMNRRTQVARHPVLFHLPPESASGTTRILRPPDAEGVSIRALPHRSVRRGAKAEANSAEMQSKDTASFALASTLAATSTTSKERNTPFLRAWSCLSSTRLQVLNQGLHLARAYGSKNGQPVLQRTNSWWACLQRTNSGLSVLVPGLFGSYWRVPQL